MHVRFGFILALLCTQPLRPQDTFQISVAAGGGPPDSHASTSSTSNDGRFVAYSSDASNIVAGDVNGAYDIFVFDRQQQTHVIVSVNSLGQQADADSFQAWISGNGRIVAFLSEATNLDPRADGSFDQVFIHDRDPDDNGTFDEGNGITQLASLAVGGAAAGNGFCVRPSLSRNGRYVTFESDAPDLVPSDSNALPDIFLKDLVTGQTKIISRSNFGPESNGQSLEPQISDDGLSVVFISQATNLVANDTDDLADVYLYRAASDKLKLVSQTFVGVKADDHCFSPSLSRDGDVIAFHSKSTTLVNNATPGFHDVFVVDYDLQTVSLASVASNGTPGNRRSTHPHVSGDGRYVAFSSKAINLVSGSGFLELHTFVHDRLAARTTLESISSTGDLSDAWTLGPRISFAGEWLTFESAATNLDPNGNSAFLKVFLRNRGTFDEIVLGGDSLINVGATGTFQWTGALPSSDYWLFYSTDLLATSVNGHYLDIGPNPVEVITGQNDSNGNGTFTTLIIPPSWSGQQFYLEVFTHLAGVRQDSNAHFVAIP